MHLDQLGGGSNPARVVSADLRMFLKRPVYSGCDPRASDHLSSGSVISQRAGGATRWQPDQLKQATIARAVKVCPSACDTESRKADALTCAASFNTPTVNEQRPQDTIERPSFCYRKWGKEYLSCVPEPCVLPLRGPHDKVRARGRKVAGHLTA